jgi:hypothetical protein
MKYYSQTQLFLSAMLHVSVQRTIIRHYFTKIKEKSSLAERIIGL